MPFHIRTSHKTAGSRGGEVYQLANSDNSVRAEIWPQWGFNCLRWQIRGASGQWDDILFVAPDWEVNPVPTRSGHPILFPFPGRLRQGTLQHRGITIRLPTNDSTGQHAIHGFTPRNAWRVLKTSTAADSASVTGEFSLCQDLPQALIHWPVDFTLRVTYKLLDDRLVVEATVESNSPDALPFGLGYHPYFRLPSLKERSIDNYVLTANMNAHWETVDQLPTGSRNPIPRRLDFRTSRTIGLTELDDVLTDAVRNSSSPEGLTQLASLAHPDAPISIQILADGSFRELVLFTPPHREAIAIEPYTCSPDAPNLAKRGMDSGWREVLPGEKWEGAVEYRVGKVD